MRFPGGAALNCWGGGAAETASSEKADNGHVTKVNHFYNGLELRLRGLFQDDLLEASTQSTWFWDLFKKGGN